MKKSIKAVATLTTIILMSSFTNKGVEAFIGSYGVSSTDPSHIQLTLNADHTFYYQDFSNHSNKVVVKGTWSQKGKKVVLEGMNSEHDFHHVWSFDKTGQVAKSRKGLSFYRLCKIEA